MTSYQTSSKILIIAAIFALAFTLNAQHLQRGISVNLPTTHNATPYPAADEDDAWIIAVPPDGSIYLGTDKMPAQDLTDEIRRLPRKRDQNLFIKVDARATFASLKPVLSMARESYFQKPILLTSQQQHSSSGAIQPPTGIQILVVPQAQDKTLVQLSNDGKMSVWINSKPAQWPDFEAALKTAMQERTSKLVQIEAGDSVPFDAIVRVLDAARANGATVALPAFHSI